MLGTMPSIQSVASASGSDVFPMNDRTLPPPDVYGLPPHNRCGAAYLVRRTDSFGQPYYSTYEMAGQRVMPSYMQMNVCAGKPRVWEVPPQRRPGYF